MLGRELCASWEPYRAAVKRGVLTEGITFIRLLCFTYDSYQADYKHTTDRERGREGVQVWATLITQ